MTIQTAIVMTFLSLASLQFIRNEVKFRMATTPKAIPIVKRKPLLRFKHDLSGVKLPNTNFKRG